MPMPTRSHSRMPGRMASTMAAKAFSELAQVMRISSISSSVLIMRAWSMVGLAWTTWMPRFLNASA